MRHMLSLGETAMEIDHFNPKLKGRARHSYKNLLLACRICNSSKSDIWPTADQRRRDIRFINPCGEMDYGVHIFEDPETHELVGETPAGKFQIDICDLNNETFIHERKARSLLLASLKSPLKFKGSWHILKTATDMLVGPTGTFIPEIPPPPAP